MAADEDPVTDIVHKVKVPRDPVHCYLLYVCQNTKKEGKKEKKELRSAVSIQGRECCLLCQQMLHSLKELQLLYIDCGVANKESNSQYTNRGWGEFLLFNYRHLIAATVV